jgi:hypothetical protein
MAALQVDGKRRVVYGHTRQEAAAKLAELTRQASQTGGLPDPGRRTVGDLLEPGWKRRRNLKPATLTQYRLEVENTCAPPGAVRLARVNPHRSKRCSPTCR